MDQDRKIPREPNRSSIKHEKSEEPVDVPPSLQDLYKKMAPEMRHPRPTDDAMAAAMEVVQRLAAEAEAENPLHAMGEASDGESAVVCPVCGYHNREDNKFCGMCGLGMGKAGESDTEPAFDESHLEVSRRRPALPKVPRIADLARSEERRGPVVAETHHYHHHYHHHYFQGEGADASAMRSAPDVARDVEKMRSSATLRGESMSRAEAAVRRVTQEWVLACNTKHLDDLLELYVADGLVLRSNYPAIRGAAAIREFFFGALDSGLGEVELDPIRVDVAGDMAYEAGKFKALVPSAAGKRREERGKYLCVFARQSGGEWKMASDCWSSDLSLLAAETDVSGSAAAIRTPTVRKTVLG